MKLNRKNKKGFTIVELVIVVGVIGILSAILIPTFTNLTNKARQNADALEVQYAYDAYAIDAADGYLNGEKAGDAGAVAHEALANTAVAIKKGDVWYHYENGWQTYTPASGKTPTERVGNLSDKLYNNLPVYVYIA